LFIITLSLYHLSSGRLREVKNGLLARSLTRGGGLQKVLNRVIWLGNVGILENWSLSREVVATGGSTVLSGRRLVKTARTDCVLLHAEGLVTVQLTHPQLIDNF